MFLLLQEGILVNINNILTIEPHYDNEIIIYLAKGSVVTKTPMERIIEQLNVRKVVENE